MKKHQPSKTPPPRGSKGPEATKCRQVAALPWRRDAKGRLVVLLVTSRTNHKWMLPKGWPMPGKSDPETASIEAHEEAGVSGEVAGAASARITIARSSTRFVHLLLRPSSMLSQSPPNWTIGENVTNDERNGSAPTRPRRWYSNETWLDCSRT